jgi:hypothetical protein
MDNTTSSAAGAIQELTQRVIALEKRVDSFERSLRRLTDDQLFTNRLRKVMPQGSGTQFFRKDYVRDDLLENKQLPTQDIRSKVNMY